MFRKYLQVRQNLFLAKYFMINRVYNSRFDKPLGLGTLSARLVSLRLETEPDTI